MVNQLSKLHINYSHDVAACSYLFESKNLYFFHTFLKHANILLNNEVLVFIFFKLYCTIHRFYTQIKVNDFYLHGKNAVYLIVIRIPTVNVIFVT